MKTRVKSLAVIFYLFASLHPFDLYAGEHTKVLPRGVRGLNIRSVETSISSKTDSNGKALPLASPLQQELTFSRIVKGEESVKGKQLQAFLLANGFSENDSVGQFTADLQGRVYVVAPIASYGLTDKLTLAIAVPYYKAKTAVEVGFQQNQRAKDFIASLASPEQNQVGSAQEAGLKLNNAVSELNAKLVANGYSELNDWSASGLGDITIAAKYLAFENRQLSSAVTGGFVAPTGRTDNPDILTDIPFGDGQWDVFGQLAFDQPLSQYVFVNQFLKYTWQLPGEKSMRDIAADEKVEVETISTRYKLGDKLDAGLSINYLSPGGVLLGVGHSWFEKYGDSFYGPGSVTKGELSKDTNQSAENGEFAIGYSTIPAFQRGKFAAPLELKLGYQRQYRSKNLPVSDLTQIDASLFF